MQGGFLEDIKHGFHYVEDEIKEIAVDVKDELSEEYHQLIKDGTKSVVRKIVRRII